MAGAPVSDSPNIHSNRVPPWQLSALNMYAFWAFKITRIRHPKKRPQWGRTGAATFREVPEGPDTILM